MKAKPHVTLSITNRLSFNAYAIIARAVEEGVRMGVHRAHKHTSTPSAEVVIENAEREVMTALCEVLQFDEPAE